MRVPAIRFWFAGFAVAAASRAQQLPAHSLAPGWNSVSLRQVPQDVMYVAPQPGRSPLAPVLFLPGDGGWRGFAVDVANQLAAQGHAVYGLDTKRYLTSFTARNKHLTTRAIAGDLHRLLRVLPLAGRKALVVGWSQGAAMAILAAHGRQGHQEVLGVVALSLPDEAALGWHWKDTLLSLFRKRPGQPHFSVMEQVPGVAPVPIGLIHPSQDDFTPLEQEATLFRAAQSPKQLRVICGANHSFDDLRPRLWQTLEEVLDWVQQAHSRSESEIDESQMPCSAGSLP